MDKVLLHQLVLQKLEQLHATALNAANQAHDSATHEENVAENKYDTLGLEASYLAEGQANIVAGYKAAISIFKKLSVRDFDEDSELTLGALVRLVDDGGGELLVFLSPVAGGQVIELQDKDVSIVTSSAPLGLSLLGSCLDDEVTVAGKSYLIADVW